MRRFAYGCVGIAIMPFVLIFLLWIGKLYHDQTFGYTLLPITAQKYAQLIEKVPGDSIPDANDDPSAVENIYAFEIIGSNAAIENRIIEETDARRVDGPPFTDADFKRLVSCLSKANNYDHANRVFFYNIDPHYMNSNFIVEKNKRLYVLILNFDEQ